MAVTTLMEFLRGKVAAAGPLAIPAAVLALKNWIKEYGRLMDVRTGGIGATEVTETFVDFHTFYPQERPTVNISPWEVLRTVVACRTEGHLHRLQTDRLGGINEIPLHQQRRSWRLQGRFHTDFYGTASWAIEASWTSVRGRGEKWVGLMTMEDTYDFHVIGVNRELYSQVLTFLGYVGTMFNAASVRVTGALTLEFPDNQTIASLFSNIESYATPRW
jgi:hypothetical protein